MPDYGTKSRSGVGESSDYRGGSGYTTSSSKSGSKASQRRKKAAIQARQRAEKALADQKKIDAAKAISSLGMTGAAQAAEKFPTDRGFGGATQLYTPPPPSSSSTSTAPMRTAAAISNQEQQRLAAEADVARQALQDLGGMTGNVPISSINKSSASRPSTAYDSSSQQTSKIITGEHSNKTAFEKMRDDFLMDIGAKEKDADYYYRLSDRTKAAEDRAKDATKITTDGPSTRLPPPQPEVEVDPFRPPPDLPPEIVDPFRPPVYPPVMPPVMPPQFPQYPGYGGGMMGGIGAFGYSPALMQFESQQGAGQVPYYMAAARNAQTPNMSPAFMHAARNYDILGGMQRTAPRPMEMMSAAERAQIAGIGSNFNTPNYNSPYAQSPPQSEFDFFKNMVSGGMPTQVPTSSFGKGNRRRMSDGFGVGQMPSQLDREPMSDRSRGLGALLSRIL